MAGTKRTEDREQAGSQKKKTKRTSSKGEESEEPDKLVAVSKKLSKAIPVPVSSATSTTAEVKTTGSKGETKLPVASDNLALLKERFNTLHEVRFTEPEKQCNELLQLLEEQKTAHETLVKRLEARIHH